jgi:hypothetical protein
MSTGLSMDQWWRRCEIDAEVTIAGTRARLFRQHSEVLLIRARDLAATARALERKAEKLRAARDKTPRPA